MDTTGFQMSRDMSGNLVYVPVNKTGLTENTGKTVGVFDVSNVPSINNNSKSTSFLNTQLGGIFGEGSWLNNPNAEGIWGNVGNTLGSLTIGDIGSGIFNGLGLYNAFKANSIAEKQLNLSNQNLAFQKDAYYKNLGNQISQYNARVDDIGNTRYKMTGDTKYLDQANERKLHL